MILVVNARTLSYAEIHMIIGVTQISPCMRDYNIGMVTNGDPNKTVVRDINGRFTTGNAVANPNGRPKRAHCISDLLYELLHNNPKQVQAKWSKVKDYPTGAMIVALEVFKKMGKGDLTAVTIGLDRVEGKVPQRTELTGNDGGPVKLETREKLAAKLEAIANNAEPD